MGKDRMAKGACDQCKHLHPEKKASWSFCHTKTCKCPALVKREARRLLRRPDEEDFCFILGETDTELAVAVDKKRGMVEIMGSDGDITATTSRGALIIARAILIAHEKDLL